MSKGASKSAVISVSLRHEQFKTCVRNSIMYILDDRFDPPHAPWHPRPSCWERDDFQVRLRPLTVLANLSLRIKSYINIRLGEIAHCARLDEIANCIRVMIVIARGANASELRRNTAKPLQYRPSQLKHQPDRPGADCAQVCGYLGTLESVVSVTAVCVRSPRLRPGRLPVPRTVTTGPRPGTSLGRRNPSSLAGSVLAQCQPVAGPGRISGCPDGSEPSHPTEHHGWSQ